MKSLLSLSFMLLNFLLCLGQQNINNPVSLGSILVNYTNIEKMSEYCECYGLAQIPSDGNLRIHRAEDGTLIKINISSDAEGNAIPYVEIHSKTSKKDIEKIIIDAGYRYHKDKDRYEKGSRYANKFTTCKILVIGNKNKRVIFTKEKGATL